MVSIDLHIEPGGAGGVREFNVSIIKDNGAFRATLAIELCILVIHFDGIVKMKTGECPQTVGRGFTEPIQIWG